MSASREDVENAAKKAELDEFIMRLPSKYETEVGESGLNLSSGEKQKIALARVILRDSPIIIFDEFTRSIDIDSKKSIFSVIRKMDDKIIIIITHDHQEIENNCNLVEIEKNNFVPAMPEKTPENTPAASMANTSTVIS
jgi:ABC-type multidrug transport system fused ATPase/permease subunit